MPCKYIVLKCIKYLNWLKYIFSESEASLFGNTKAVSTTFSLDFTEQYLRGRFNRFNNPNVYITDTDRYTQKILPARNNRWMAGRVQAKVEQPLGTQRTSCQRVFPHLSARSFPLCHSSFWQLWPPAIFAGKFLLPHTCPNNCHKQFVRLSSRDFVAKKQVPVDFWQLPFLQRRIRRKCRNLRMRASSTSNCASSGGGPVVSTSTGEIDWFTKCEPSGPWFASSLITRWFLRMFVNWFSILMSRRRWNCLIRSSISTWKIDACPTSSSCCSIESTWFVWFSWLTFVGWTDQITEAVAAPNQIVLATKIEAMTAKTRPWMMCRFETSWQVMPGDHRPISNGPIKQTNL